jgi:hypothetical protein
VDAHRHGSAIALWDGKESRRDPAYTNGAPWSSRRGGVGQEYVTVAEGARLRQFQIKLLFDTLERRLYPPGQN